MAKDGSHPPLPAPPLIASFADAVALAVRTLERELGDSAVWVGHLDDDRAVLRVVAAGGDASFGLEAGVEAPLESSYCHVMASDTGAPLCNGVADDPVYRALPATAGLGVGSFMGAPLRLADGSAVGTVCAFHRDRGAYSARQLALVETFAAFLTREIEHQRRTSDLEMVNRDLRRQATTDALTGLPNRRAFDGVLQRAWRRGAPAHVLLLDVDDLKRINDEHGHAVGDAAIVAVADAILTACGPGDTAARLGGDEFAVILRSARLDAFRDGLASALDRVEGVRPGVSLGAAPLAGAETAGAALAAADAALYADKPAARSERRTAA